MALLPDELPKSDTAEPMDQIQRLRRSLEALSADLDAIEQRPHLLLRSAAEALDKQGDRGIESFVDRFAFAVRKRQK